jgi:hypothetical protein
VRQWDKICNTNGRVIFIINDSAYPKSETVFFIGHALCFREFANKTLSRDVLALQSGVAVAFVYHL